MKTAVFPTLTRVSALSAQPTSRNPLRIKGLDTISCMCVPPISIGAVFLTSCKAVGGLFLPSEKMSAPLDSAP